MDSYYPVLIATEQLDTCCLSGVLCRTVLILAIFVELIGDAGTSVVWVGEAGVFVSMLMEDHPTLDKNS